MHFDVNSSMDSFTATTSYYSILEILSKFESSEFLERHVFVWHKASQILNTYLSNLTTLWFDFFCILRKHFIKTYASNSCSKITQFAIIINSPLVFLTILCFD